MNNRQIESAARVYRKLYSQTEIVPVARRTPEVVVNPGGPGTEEPVNLSGCPPNLLVLWNESETEVGGNKPATHFTQTERSNAKHKYSHRSRLWKGVERIICRGTTCDAAIQRVYDVYKPLHRVTAIHSTMRIDERNGGHTILC